MVNSPDEESVPDDDARFDAALRDAFAGLSSDAQPAPPRAEPARHGQGTSNYEILDEIARGGMGTVFRARSQQLGREVALKILRPDLQFSSEAGLRFLTEARIAGKLQHPGIVPIYDVGTLEDGRRYFAMKLVEGHTLAEETEGGQSTTRLLKFVGILEQISHAMAYAHSRGVVHRDLKPSNIMIGGFGEVLVMDWGLAKVLCELDAGPSQDRDRASDPGRPAATSAWLNSEPGRVRSVSGTVFGTPAYMSPEQARGEVEAIDARTDVFALGSILTEILTGEPAYTGSSATVLQDAAAGNLTGAFDRLRRSTWDPELTQIARICLAANAHDRPQDARWLSQQLSEYLSNVAKRSEQARLEAATERAKAASAQRARNLTVALSLLAVATVAGASVVYFQWTHQRNTRISRQVESIQEALFASTTAAQQGQWSAALAHVERVRGLPDLTDVPLDLRNRVEQAFAAAAAAVNADATERARVTRNAGLLKDLALNRVSELIQIEYEPDWRTVDAHFARTFQRFDLDPDVGEIPAVIERLAATGIPMEFAGVLDEWANYRKRAHNLAGSSRLVQLARQLDPDPVRNKIRDALETKDIATMLSFAGSLDAAQVSPLTLRILARALAQSGELEASIRCARTAQRAFPDDFTTNLALAHGLWNRGRKYADEAVRYYTSARSIRPDSIEALLGLGQALLDGLADYESALEAFRAAQKLHPLDPYVHWSVGNALFLLNRLDDAIAAYRHALELKPQFVRALASLANAYQRQGKLREARETFETVVTMNVEDGKSYYVRGLSFMMLGRTDEAIADFRKTIELCPNHAGGYNNLGALLNDKLKDYAGAAAAFRQAIQLDPGVAKQHTNLANALRGLRRDDEALESYTRALQLDPRDFWTHYGLSGLFLDGQKLDEALSHANSARALDPRSYHAMNQIGLIQKARKDFRAAAVAFEKAVELNPKLAATRAQLVESWFQCGEKGRAQAAWRELTKREPADSGLVRNTAEQLKEAGFEELDDPANVDIKK